MAATGTVTGATAILTLTIPPLFTSPQQIQGFQVDDVVGTDALESAETLMGVDGYFSAGFVYVPVPFHIHLQADSPSNVVFDNWWSSQQQVKDLYVAGGILIIPAIGKKYSYIRGFLKTFPPNPVIKKLLQPRTYTIHWQTMTISNV